MDLQTVWENVQKIVEQQRQIFFAEYRQTIVSIDPWSVQVFDRLDEYTSRSGKALRPLLVAIGAAVGSEEKLDTVLSWPSVQRAMLLVELKHKRILMADDVADQDEQRNGRPAFHVLWEEDLKKINYYQAKQKKMSHIARSYTEIAGIWLDSLSTFLLESDVFSDSQRRQLIYLLQQHIYDRTVAGWYTIFDQSFEPLNNQVSEQRLINGLELVSGEYTFVGPLRIGFALAAHDTQSKQSQAEQALINYGQNAGILFQITDDLLGAFGDPQKTGKPVGGDFREGKKTLLVQQAYRSGSKQQQTFLQQWIGQQDISAEQVSKIQEIMLITGAKDFANYQAKRYAKQAQECLKKTSLSIEVEQILEDLVNLLLTRQK